MSLRARAAPLQGELLFREVQTFGWPWPGMLIVTIGLFTAGAVVVPFSVGMWEQLVIGRPWGDRPMPDAMLYVVGPLAILLSLLPFALLVSRLQVEVRTDGMRIELVRFRRPQVIAREQVREARPARIRWSGWGATDTLFRRVYRMAGSEGVEIELTRGKKVVVGSERARALLDAVRRMMEEGTRS